MIWLKNSWKRAGNDNDNEDCDDDLLSIVADDKQQHDEVTSVDLKGEEEVTNQDLDSMKQMIHDMPGLINLLSIQTLLFHVKMIVGKQWLPPLKRRLYRYQFLRIQSSPHRYPIQQLDDGQLRVHLLLQHGRYLEEQLKVPCHTVKNVVIVQQKYQSYHNKQSISRE